MTELTYHPVASAADLADGEMKRVTVGKRSIAIYNLGGTFYASDAHCTHGHALLTEGYIDGTLVECPMHGGTFDIPTGKAVGQPCATALETYPVKVDAGVVSVGLREGAES